MLSIMAEQQPKKLHVAVFPWLAFGHIIPFFELSKLIAQKGHKISFISTPRNIKRLPQIPTSLKTLINLISIPLPPTNNLPENAEATTDIPPHIVPHLKIAFDNLQDPLVQFLQNSNPDWIIHDFAPHWLPPITSKLGIFRNFFSIFNASTLSFLLDSFVPEFHADERIKPEDFIVPPKWVNFPSRVAFRLHEARKFFVHFEENKSGVSDIFRMKAIFVGADVLSPRSCREIEGEYLDVIQDFSGKTVIPVGLLPPSIQIRDEDSKSDGNWDKINEWLNKQEMRSVVYVAFGSELPLTQNDITELALGLELSGLPFLWVLRKMDSAYQLPDGFEQRCSGRGIVWMEWAPQARILGHKSTGGFLTHCGWSSVIESLHVGCPLILLPFQMDQGLISRLLEDKRLGAEVPRDEECGKFTRESLAKSLKLVVMEEEGKVYRNKAKEMSKIFGDREVQYKYVDNLICHFENVSLKSKLA